MHGAVFTRRQTFAHLRAIPPTRPKQLKRAVPVPPEPHDQPRKPMQLVARPRHEYATEPQTGAKLVLETEARNGIRNVEDVLGCEGRALDPAGGENHRRIEAIVWRRDAVQVHGLGLGHHLLVTMHGARMRC